MRNRTRKDGTVEFSNRPEAAPREAPVPAPAAPEHGRSATFWSRERADGVVEFTNQRPAGENWKVWLKTGPGKAGALRGRTDRVPRSRRFAGALFPV